MTHDSDYSRRAAEARAAACHKGESEDARIAGDLALAYAALARRRMLAQAEPDPTAEQPLVLQD